MADTMVKIAGLYENTSQKTGKRYFVGYAGPVKVLVFEARDPKDGEPTWSLFFAERGERPVQASTKEAVPAEEYGSPF